MSIPKITGPDMLRAVQQATQDLPAGSDFAISLFDSYDLCKVTADQLVHEFDFDREQAEKVDQFLSRSDLSELSKAIRIRLIVDKTLRKSLIANAGIIRSAGAWADDTSSLQEMNSFFDQLRHPQG